MAGRALYVAVVGTGESRPDEIAAAEEVGRRLAEAGGMGELRNGLIVRSADALIAIGGAETSFGTLSEIALARRTGLPVICLGSWEIEGVELADSPRDAVRRALELAR